LANEQLTQQKHRLYDQHLADIKTQMRIMLKILAKTELQPN